MKKSHTLNRGTALPFYALFVLFTFLFLLNALTGSADAQTRRSPVDVEMDPAFNAAVTEGTAIVYDTAVQPDGKIIVAGAFSRMGAISFSNLARLNADGSPDTGFNIGAGANAAVRAVTLQPDGKIIVVGLFTSFNNQTVRRIVRLNTDGSLDASFNTQLNINNSIIANSASGGDCGRSNGTINAEYSLIEDGLGCVNGTNQNNLTGDPKLGPLQDNGGATFTHALLAGSPAIDKGNSTLTTDQRGFSRPVDDPASPNGSGNLSDIGAFEVQWIDADGDGVRDEDDNCPTTPNPNRIAFRSN